MDHSDLLRFFGGETAAARGLGLDRGTVRHWKHSGIPNPMQYYIEAFTDGALLAPPLPCIGVRSQQRQAQRIAAAARKALKDKQK